MKPRAAHRVSDPSPNLRLVRLEKPVYGGAFLARDQGKAVFVPLTLPGEEARVRIVEDKGGYAKAEAAEIVAAAPQRVTPECRHFGACGGCHYQHASYEAQLGFKQSILRETLERAGVRPPDEIAVLAAGPWAYRNRIRLAFAPSGAPGYRARRSHAIVPIAECPIAAPLLVRAALAAAEIVRQSPPARRPAEISLFCDAEESSLLAGIYAGGAAKLPFEELCRALAAQVPELQGAEYVVEDRAGRSRPMAQWGAPSLDYRAAGFTYRVDHGAFFQVNRWLVDALAERVTAGHQGGVAWDLFAGVGLFARRLAANFARVIAVESAPSATGALEHNLRGTGATAERSATLDFLRRSHRDEQPELVIADPPRTGLGAETTPLLARCAAPALVYVSCDPATLARDLRALIGSGYSIHEITVADLFPQTFHIETIVHLRR
ncbi:MAG TPA: 23S rRNA (uracil(1939)-C(5))-methyltransferase RlmD [Terracidiphilus sp.]|jgi:23S rRNA (uracil1939-C5)-methyltransferase